MSAALQLVYSRPEQPQETKRMQDGFVAVPNGMMDALLSADLTGRQLKMALAIIRKTIGYGKTSDDCTITQLAEVAGLHRPDASKALQQLIERNIVEACKGRHGQVVCLKSPENWKEESTTNVANYYEQNATNVAKHYEEAEQNATHNRQLQQTITTTPCIPQSAEPTKPAKAKKPIRAACTFKAWEAETRAAGDDLLPADDPIFTYAADAGIPLEFMRLAWVEFRDKYRDNSKRYADWRAAFRNCVRDGWFKLWFFDAGEYALTYRGQQAMRAMQARQQREVQPC